MKTLFTRTLVAVALAAPLAVIGSHAVAGPSPEKMLERLDSQLDLSDEQEAKMREILDASQAERKSHREQVMEQMNEVLNAEQQAKLETMKERRMKHHRKGGQRSPEKMVKRLDKRLDLSDEQEAQILSIFQAQAPDAKSMDKEQRRAQREQMQLEIQGVLSAEQNAQFESMMSDRKHRYSGSHD